MHGDYFALDEGYEGSATNSFIKLIGFILRTPHGKTEFNLELLGLGAGIVNHVPPLSALLVIILLISFNSSTLFKDEFFSSTSPNLTHAACANGNIGWLTIYLILQAGKHLP